MSDLSDALNKAAGLFVYVASPAWYRRDSLPTDRFPRQAVCFFCRCEGRRR